MQIETATHNISSYRTYLALEDATHRFMKKRGYLKVELPLLSPALIPESYLDVFETEFNYIERKEKLYLVPSPELFLKRLLTQGIGNCYYLGKSFRNADPNASLHSYEFTMLEFYRVNVTYMDIAREVLALLRFVAKQVFHADHLIYQKEKISLSRWEKLTVAEAFERYAQISKRELLDHEKFLNRAKKKGYVTYGFGYEDLFSQIYTAEVEPHLGKNGYPTLIYDYPKEFAALAKHKNEKIAERFEFYIAGVELGDCYTELTDWKEQEKRFFEEEKRRRQAKKTVHPVDKGFIQALQYGLGDCSGIAIGFDRLAMVFADVTSIDQLKLIRIV